jgi:uncharacterized protein YegL
MTDGKPFDTQLYAEQCLQIRKLGFASIIGCAAGPKARDEDLRPLCDHIVRLNTMDSSAFNKLFRWVSEVIASGGADRAVLSRLSDDIIPFDDTVDGAFKKFINWITALVKSSTRSLTAGGGISLTKLDPDVSGGLSGKLPFEAVYDRYTVFVGRCTASKAPYVVKYERYIDRIDAQDARS